MLFSVSEGVSSTASRLPSCTQTTPLSGYQVGGNPGEEDPSNYAHRRKGCGYNNMAWTFSSIST